MYFTLDSSTTDTELVAKNIEELKKYFNELKLKIDDLENYLSKNK